MKKTSQMLLVSVVGLLAGPMAADAQAEYEYQSIEYPGALLTQVFGINGRGAVAGTGYGLSDTDCFPFVYDTKKATFKDVAPVAGYDCTAVLDISDSGYLVGVVDYGSGLIVDKEGNATVFDHPDAISQTLARGINNDGLVAGTRDGDPDDGEGLQNGFIYDSETNTFTDIVPSALTIAQGINSKGDVVGSAVFADGIASDPCGTAAFVRYGWLRTPDGNVIYFDVNGWSTNARGITDQGVITGWATDPGTGTVKSFVTELDGAQCQSITIPDSELLVMPGELSTAAQDIKNSGEIVGTGLDTLQGFIATPQ